MPDPESQNIPFMNTYNSSTELGYWTDYNNYYATTLYAPFGMGRPFGAATCNALFLVRNVRIPPGATITAAHIRFYSGSNFSSGNTLKSRIYAQAADNPSSLPGSAANCNAMTLTTAYATWETSAAWTADQPYQSADISSVIQEIIDRAGWSIGNSILLTVKDNGSASGEGRSFMAGNTFHRTPRLVVSWTHPSKWTGWAANPNVGSSNGIDTFDATTWSFYRDSDKNRHPFAAFTCNVPAGVTIKDARMQVFSWVLTTPAWSWHFHCADADNPSVPTSIATYNALSKTSGASTPVTAPTTTTTMTRYEISGLEIPIQQVISRAGWAAGNRLIVLGDSNMDTNGQSWTDSYYSSNPADGNHAFEAFQPLLEIEFEKAAGGNKIMMVN